MFSILTKKAIHEIIEVSGWLREHTRTKIISIWPLYVKVHVYYCHLYMCIVLAVALLPPHSQSHAMPPTTLFVRPWLTTMAKPYGYIKMLCPVDLLIRLISTVV